MFDRTKIFRTVSECVNYYQSSVVRGTYCKTDFDGFFCWPPTESGLNLTFPCPRVSSVGGKVIGYTTIPEAYATRQCEDNGYWLNNRTNFDRCIEYIEVLYEEDPLQTIVAYIVFIGCIFSLVALGLSLFIFCYFKNLHCTRLKVHRNLCTALIIHLFFLFLRSTGPIFDYSFYNTDWLCKTMLALLMYSSMATTNWMFLEGLLLHNRVAVNIFRQDAPFKLYYFIGWAVPLVIVSIWSGVMEKFHESRCWKYFGQSDFIYIIVVPTMIALLVNTVFLINIIRILMTRRPNTASVERSQIKKAVKATALLFPLLGITHLLFCYNPPTVELQTMYMIMNALIQSTQGLIVSVLYCFMNNDVQTALKNAYIRSIITRNPNRRLTTQTSHTFVSHSEGTLTNGSPGQKISTKVSVDYQQETGSKSSRQPKNYKTSEEESSIMVSSDLTML